ncbi:MAG: PAS domain-containing hybrid sensor histidine kinase/response regulator [Pseudomonadota bacterium]
MSPVILIGTLVAYLAVLFWIARIGDRYRFSNTGWPRHPLVYTFALGVYCTSWTFYGLVGTAALRGWHYLPILLGPALTFTLGFPLLQRISIICRREHIHSIADFISSRYGKRQSVAAIVTLLLLIATVPYIALQLKAVTDTLIFVVDGVAFASQDMTMFVTVVMILFTLFFGANRLDVASYHSGIMATIAFESIVKLVALVAVAIFALSLSQGFDPRGPGNSANIVFGQSILTPSFWVLTLVSAAMTFCLPRMFQITFVECLSDRHLRFARVGFCIYLILIILAVFTIAWTGNQFLSESDTPRDTYVLALPLAAGNKFFSLLAFVGGFSAATAMIIVASLTISQMLSNDVLLPLLIRSKRNQGTTPDYSTSLFLIRRCTVVAVILMAWLYQHELGENVALTEIGLFAFALVVQLAPAIVAGIYWQRSNAMGVLAGLGCGSLMWFYTLMIPHLHHAGFITGDFVTQGPFGWQNLSPTHLFGLTFSDNYTRGVVLSLTVNIFALYWVSSFNITRLSDRIQSLIFANRDTKKERQKLSHFQITRVDLAYILSQFLGESATQKIFANELGQTSVYVSAKLLMNAEQVLAGVVGVASARALLSSLSTGESLGVEDVVNIFEETTRSLRFSQEMLAASFESISSAISVVNADLKIVAWNKRYEQMFNYPQGLLCVGRPVAELVRFNAERGLLGAGDVEQHVQTRLSHLLGEKSYRVVRNHHQSVIEIKGRPLPKGGYVTTYDDISEFIHAQNELEKANQHLEQRVHERTREIENINDSLRKEIQKRSATEIELTKAKAAAENANISKTQFLAAASHDILQPLNAANLYASALLEKPGLTAELLESLQHLHGAIGSAESIISNLLEISRLDTGTLTPTNKIFALCDILDPLAHEFQVQVRRGVEFHYQASSLCVASDPNYLRRILQNFLSNAIKYTVAGKILFGCRHRNNFVEVCVYDTGSGISEANQQHIFDDFYRIAHNVEGAGLGLGIALRFAKLLDHPLQVSSCLGQGSLFSVLVPIRAKHLIAQQIVTSLATTSGLENFTAWYIDDEENNIHALAALMSNWGCTLAQATDRASIKSYLDSGKIPNAVLIDYQLGEGLNGIQLAKQLREHWPDMPICIVSAAQQEDLAAIASAHGYDFLRKPIKPGKLRAFLERYTQHNNDVK